MPLPLPTRPVIATKHDETCSNLAADEVNDLDRDLLSRAREPVLQLEET